MIPQLSCSALLQGLEQERDKAQGRAQSAEAALAEAVSKGQVHADKGAAAAGALAVARKQGTSHVAFLLACLLSPATFSNSRVAGSLVPPLGPLDVLQLEAVFVFLALQLTKCIIPHQLALGHCNGTPRRDVQSQEAGSCALRAASQQVSTQEVRFVC